MYYVKSFKELKEKYLAELETIQASNEHQQLKSMAQNELRRWFDAQHSYLSSHGENTNDGN